jgi:hypothetical protein
VFENILRNLVLRMTVVRKNEEKVIVEVDT